ncbi:MAG: hypothetical protein OXC14_01055 [Rhodospirillaceae bacterium]|nr:hypothetical protein [Rhodospirillaceae bacterium]
MDPPTVGLLPIDFLSAGTIPTPEETDAVVRAIQLVNAALPADWQLTYMKEAHYGGYPDIAISFHKPLALPRAAAEWNCGVDAIGCTDVRFLETGEITSAIIVVDRSRTSDPYMVDVLMHELLHALGRGHPDWHDLATVMHPTGGAKPGHVLQPIDREALQAVYSRLDPGDSGAEIYEKLGSWSDSVLHVMGAVEYRETYFGLAGLLPTLELDPVGTVEFGVASFNGEQRPWASGPAPLVDLEDNPGLHGTASWYGRLLGLTPLDEAVAGSVQVTVELTKLQGDVFFRDLEAWPPSAPTGPIGTGMKWSDGDLRYPIKVRGSTFIQIPSDGSGDEGIVTGAFFGTAHEAMGGTLERGDLGAAFGGAR